jgi:hypothetical protein
VAFLIIWAFVFAFVVIHAVKERVIIDGKLYKFHVFLSWLLLILHHTGFARLVWAVGHPAGLFAGSEKRACADLVAPLNARLLFLFSPEILKVS